LLTGFSYELILLKCTEKLHATFVIEPVPSDRLVARGARHTNSCEQIMSLNCTYIAWNSKLYVISLTGRKNCLFWDLKQSRQGEMK
jgi:hypothetical protein